MSKPDRYQDYTEVCLEILKVLSKHKITYNGFNLIMEQVRKEVDLFTFIDVDDTYKEE